MKKLLLLFIPLMFFFGCETEDNTTGYNCAETGCVESASAESGYFLNLEDCESNCNCSCGVVTEYIYVPAFAGEYVIDVNDSNNNGDNTEIIVVGDHPDYTYANVQNNCSGNNAMVCGSPEIGEIYCMEYQCFFSECNIFDISSQSFISQYTFTDCIDLDCDCEPTLFN